MHKSVLLLLCCGIALSASPVSVQVNVNTSSVAGTTGNVDFQYNPGFGVADPSFITIDFFTPGGQINGVRQISGDVTGLLPGSLRIGNATNFNDYFEGFTFTNSLSFLVTFDGPASTGLATSGSLFLFSLYAADEVTPLLANFPDLGAYAAGNVGPNGELTFSTPEPATIALFGIGLLMIGVKVRTRSYGRKA